MAIHYVRHHHQVDSSEAANHIHLEDIDPTQMTTLQRFIVGEYLTHLGKNGIPHRDFISANQAYTLKRHGMTYTFTLTKSLLRFRRNAFADPYRFEVISEVPRDPANGSFGRVLPTQGRLAIQKNLVALFKTAAKRVIKIQTHTHDWKADKIDREAELTRALPHTHAKQAIHEHQESYIVMRRFESMSLETLLLKIKRKEWYLTSVQKMNIVRALLSRLQTQIHDHDMIHCDIKPANIMIDIDEATKEIKAVNYCDFGLSKFTKEVIKESGGSPFYSAPEQFKDAFEKTNLSDPSSDGFALAIVIGQLFGIANPRGVWPSATRMIPWIHYNEGDLYTDTPKQPILPLLQALTKRKQSERCSIKEASEKLETIRIAEVLKTVHDPILQGKLLVANQQARIARKLLNATNIKIQDIQSIIDTHLKAIDQEPRAVQEFIETLDVQAFKGLHTKTEILAKTNAIMKEFATRMDYLLQVHQSLHDLVAKYKNKKTSDYCPALAAEANKLLKRVDAVLEKNKKFAVNVDDIVALSERFEKEKTALSSLLETDAKAEDTFHFSPHFVESIHTREKLREFLTHAIEQYEKSGKISHIRKNDIQDIKDLIHRSNNTDEMIELVEVRLQYIKKGYFEREYLNLFPSSRLVNHIKKAIQSYKNWTIRVAHHVTEESASCRISL